MGILTEEIIRFLKKQSFVVIATIDGKGMPHTSCKGIVKIEKNGKIYILDLYKRKTYDNLINNPGISITAVDEHKFKGWCLKGKARIVPGGELSEDIIRAWEKRIAIRITRRLIKNMAGTDKGHARHPESQFPRPEYMIVVDVDEIVDLIPYHVT